MRGVVGGGVPESEGKQGKAKRRRKVSRLSDLSPNSLCAFWWFPV